MEGVALSCPGPSLEHWQNNCAVVLAPLTSGPGPPAAAGDFGQIQSGFMWEL
jgi:hypothetical protein